MKELQKIMAEFDTKWHAPCADYIGAEETAVGANTIKVTAKKQLEKFARSYNDHLTGSRERVPARAGDAYKPLAGCMEAADEEERREIAAKPYRQVIGSAANPARLWHLSMAYALSELSQYVSDPSRRAWRMLQVAGNSWLRKATKACTSVSRNRGIGSSRL